MKTIYYKNGLKLEIQEEVFIKVVKELMSGLSTKNRYIKISTQEGKCNAILSLDEIAYII